MKEYTAGLRVCPLSFPKDRAVLYSNRAATRAKLVGVGCGVGGGEEGAKGYSVPHFIFIYHPYFLLWSWKAVSLSHS